MISYMISLFLYWYPGHRFRGKNRLVRCFMWYEIIHDSICDIRYDILLWAGLYGVTGTLPQQSEPGGFIQRHNWFWLAGRRPGAVCASSTLLQLYLMSHRHQGARVQCFAQGGVRRQDRSVLQHVWAHQSDSGQHHAAGWGAHALWLGQQPVPDLPLHLMWRYGRGRPRMVSIDEAERIRRKRISESRIRAGETRKWCSEATAGAGAAEDGGGAQWSWYFDIIYNIIRYVYMISCMILKYDIKLHIILWH